MNHILETAMQWVEYGHAVIPIKYRSKKPMVQWEVHKTQLPTIDQLKYWFPCTLRNIGLVTGWNNLVVIDWDDWIAYEIWQSMMNIQTYMVKTRRGMHVYLKVKQPVTNFHSELLDIKANGYVLIPPSIHPNGFAYQSINNLPILEIDNLLDVVPESLLAPPQNTEFPLEQTKKIPASDDPWETIMRGPELDQDMIAQIREKMDITSLLVDVEPTSGDGRWFVAKCPFHSDGHPSFWIDKKRQICGCYAGCTPKPLDVINLYARLHGLTNRDAIFMMAHQL